MTAIRLHARAIHFVVVAVLCIGGVTRLVAAGRVPLIFDEYQWSAVAEQVSVGPLNLPLHGDAHPAATAYLIAASTAAFGSNLIGYRFPSVLAGTLLIGVAFLLGSRLGGATVGLIAALLVAGNEYLFGISRLATEKSIYLTFALGGVWAFQRALERGRTIDFAVCGTLLGLGLMAKETLVLWIPILAWELAARRGWRSFLERGPLLGAAIMVLAVLPDMIWNICCKVPSLGFSSRGIVDHLGRLHFGWSFGPLALFVRPAFQLIESGVSEYPSMTTLAGLTLLVGAAMALRATGRDDTRLWLRLGWIPFLFFCYSGSPSAGSVEFWWADLSVLPFILLTAVQLCQVSLAIRFIVVGVTVAGTLLVAAAKENCYPAIGRVAASYVRVCEQEQHALIARTSRIDPDAVTRFGPWRLPAATGYLAAAAEYHARLSAGASSPSNVWPPMTDASRRAERDRMSHLMQVLRTK